MPNHRKKSAKRVRYRDLWPVISAFRAGIGAWIPSGYQDENGFHYGIEPIALVMERLVDSRQPA
jgi:hypothetical protein